MLRTFGLKKQRYENRTECFIFTVYIDSDRRGSESQKKDIVNLSEKGTGSINCKIFFL